MLLLRNDRLLTGPGNERLRNWTRGSASLRRDLLPQVQADDRFIRNQLELPLSAPVAEKSLGRDPALEAIAVDLLRRNDAAALAAKVRVEWSARLRSAAGRAEYLSARVLLNCRLCAHGAAEIDRTLRHELAHLLASFRAGRRRIAPHGSEWRRACADLGIAGESRCHTLPFPIRRRARPYVYVCPNCRRDFPRTRRLKRTSACLACCRAHNRGRFDARFKLQRAHPPAPPPLLSS
ncbi:MAG: SprT-like domain-containing protein [Chthoniobacterales bacterium]|nr:SprT-like domain-containing protein [Chthoniobacterales bacterium]